MAPSPPMTPSPSPRSRLAPAGAGLSRRHVLGLGIGAVTGALVGCADSTDPGTTASTTPALAPTRSPTATSSPTATPTPTPALPPVRHEPSLPALMRRTFAGAAPERMRQVAETGAWTKHEVLYPSGDLDISGVLYVPTGAGPFPGVVLAHGYIPPERYVTGQGMAREQEYLAGKGFVVLHTDYRGHAASSSVDALDLESRVGYAEDVLNAAQSLKEMAEVDGDAVALFGRSMGGGVVQNALVAGPGIVRAGVCWASVSSRFIDNYERWIVPERPGRAEELQARYGPPTDENTFYNDLSARSFFDRVTEPVLLDHGTSDSTCPIGWSRQTARLMQEAGVDVRLLERQGEEHTYTTQWQQAMDETYEFLR